MKLYELEHLETLQVTYFIKAFYLNMMTPGVNSFSYVFSFPHIFNAFEKELHKTQLSSSIFHKDFPSQALCA